MLFSGKDYQGLKRLNGNQRHFDPFRNGYAAVIKEQEHHEKRDEGFSEILEFLCKKRFLITGALHLKSIGGKGHRDDREKTQQVDLDPCCPFEKYIHHFNRQSHDAKIVDNYKDTIHTEHLPFCHAYRQISRRTL